MAINWSLKCLKMMELLEELRGEAMNLRDALSNLVKNRLSAQDCSTALGLVTLMATSIQMIQL